MKKRLAIILTAVMVLAFLFTGCASRGKSADTASVSGRATAAQAPSADAKNLDVQFNEAQKGEAAPAESPKQDAIGITGDGSSSTLSNAILAERKLIRKANVTVEVDNFDEAYGKLNTIITGIGYVQESNINAEKIYVDANQQKLLKRGVIILRVDKDKYDSVLNSIKGIGIVLNENQGVEEVTDKFYDIESSLRLLKYEQSRLEAYLQKITDPDTIFKTESRLTDIRHEIENLTVNLNKLSSLVDLSTITVNLNEKMPGVIINNTKNINYGDRLLGKFVNSIKGVVNFCGDFLLLIAQLLPVLLLLGLFALIGWLIYRRISKFTDRQRNNKRTPPAPPMPPTNFQA